MQYVITRQQESIKPTTIKYELSMLRRAFNLAIVADKLQAKPHFPNIEVRNTRERFFTESEYQSVLSHLPAEVRPLAEFLWLTGWRKTEALTLEWGRVDWTGRSIRLPADRAKNKDVRILPFGNYPQLESLLERQRGYTQQIERAKSMIVPWVFHRDGKPIKSFRSSWDKACAEVGVLGAWVHDFRRCTVRHMEPLGIPRATAMKITGHRREGTYRRYVITTAQDVADATGRLSAYTEKPSLGKARTKQAVRQAIR